MPTTQFLYSFVTCHEDFEMNAGNWNPIVPGGKPPVTRSLIYSLLVLVSVKKNRKCFPPVNDAISFGTVDYDVHIKTKIEYSIDYVFKSMTIQEPNTLHHICELGREPLLSILDMSVQNLDSVGDILTWNRGKILYVEGSNAWLNDCRHFLWPPYELDRCLDCRPINFEDNVMYIDPTRTRIFNHATPTSCDINPQIFIASW